MVFAVRPVIGLAKVPGPLPLTVWVPFISGLGAVPQQTPRADIDGPLPVVALPPDNAVLAVIEVVATVVTVGKRGTGSGAFCWHLKEMKAKSKMVRMCFIYYGLMSNVGNKRMKQVLFKTALFC